MPRKYLLPLTVLGSLIFSWVLAPFATCAADIPLRLTADKQVIYPQESTTVKAEVYAEESGQWLPCGSGVGWDLSNNTAGNYVYNGDTLVYTAYAENSLHLDQPWDSAKTVIKATYSVGGQVYEAELPAVLVYPLRAKGNPVEKALVWLRTKQKDDGSFVANAGEWAVSAVAAAGYNPVGAGWQKNGNSHLSQLESTVRDLQDKTQYFRSLTDYARVAVSVAAAAYYDSSWRARLTDFGGVNLIAKIKEAQDENGHFGKGSDAQLVNSHVWAVLALKAAGEEIPNAAGARSWLEGVQNPDGGWGYTADKNDPWGGCLSDSNDTADAVRALVALGGTNKGEGSPLKKALDYLSSCQADDGGFFWSPSYGGAGDAGSDARVILALKAAGEDPYKWKKNGNDPVYHLLSLQAEDGSFLYQAGTPPYGEWGAVSLVADAITALAGVPLLELPPPARPPGSGTSDSGTITVEIIVRGLDGTAMYESRPVQLGPGEQTPLGALKKTVASVELGYGGAYVAGIDGLREKQYGATSGWCYRVNGEEIQASAADYRLKDGDYVEWVYVRSLAETSKLLEKQEELNAPVPVSLAQQNKFLAGELRASEEALAALEKMDWFGSTGGGAGKPVYLGENEAGRSVVVTGERPEISPFDIVARKKDLAGNRIDLNQKVTAEKGAVIADAKAEMALIVPAEAMKTDTEISVQEKPFSFAGETGAAPVPAVPAGYRPVSPLYRLGPEGTLFDKPVTLYIRIVIPPLVRPENLALAWHNEAEGRWEAVPAAVVDASRGLVLARLAHFSGFAVFARDSKKSFADVTPDNFGWARDTIETLAGAGILAGVDGTRFEPERPLTRAEFASLLVKALALREKGEPGELFSDVKTSSWYAGAVAAAAGAGLLQGYGDGTFRPEQKVTREEIAAVLARVMNLKPAGEKLSFRDSAKISPWAREAVAAAAAQGLVKGFPDGTFRPDAPAGRAEGAAMIYRVLACCEG